MIFYVIGLILAVCLGLFVGGIWGYLYALGVIRGEYERLTKGVKIAKMENIPETRSIS